MLSGDVFRNARFREEAWGYSPKAVDAALKSWAAVCDSGDVVTSDEISDAKFGRDIRGYRRSDVDGFLKAIIDGVEPPAVPAGGLASVLSGSLGQLLLVSMFFAAIVGVDEATKGHVVGYLELAAPLVLGLIALVLWRRNAPGAHS